MMITSHPLRKYISAGHPLRRRIKIEHTPLLSREPLSDLQLFLMTFAAGFLAFYGMLF